jgi:hypothetical protein
MDATRILIFSVLTTGASWTWWLHYRRRHMRRVMRSLQNAIRKQVEAREQAEPRRQARAAA